MLIDGTPGPDSIPGADENDTINGLGGNDRLGGGNGADTLNGGEGDDLLLDGITVFNPDGTVSHTHDRHGDTLNGGNGNDRIIAYIGDSIHGGAGFDRLTLGLASPTGLIFDMRIVEAGGTIFVPGITPGAGDSYTLTANGAQISGIEQLEFLAMTEGDDIVYGTTTNDSISGGAGDDNLHGMGGDDVLDGSTGTNTLDGGGGNDILGSTSAGLQYMYGGAGDDQGTMNVPGSSFDGGAGFDRVTVNTTTSGSYDFRDLANNGSVYLLPDFNTISNVEQLAINIATGNVDFLGSAINEHITTLTGSLNAHGGGGDDILSGSAINALTDVLSGNVGNDVLYGFGGNDWLVGGGGDDVLEGGAGTNMLIGGDGLDLASYSLQSASLWINLSAGVYSAAGVWDVFDASLEGVVGGSGNDSIFGNTANNTLRGGDGRDALIGNGGNDRLEGGLGDDWLVGGDGDDRLVGGAGVDVLTGGAGADTFDLGATAGWDVAFDFNTAQDRVSLGGHTWSGFFTIDADNDGQTDDTLLGYAGGNFVALNVAGLTLAQWNALVVAPASAVAGEKTMADDPLAAFADDWQPDAPPLSKSFNDTRALDTDLPAIAQDEPSGWGMFG